MIDLLIPVLNRPGNVQPLLDSIEAATTATHRTVFLVSPDDHDEIIAIRKAGAPMIRSPGISWAQKINLGAKLSRAEFLFLGADDLNFHKGWDMAAISRWEETRKPVVGTNDLANPTVMRGDHATHFLVHRSYLLLGTADNPDKLLHDGYHHMFVDNEFVETAKWRDAWVFAPDSVVEHLHPIYRDVAWDDTYKRGMDQKLAQRDRKLWQSRRHLWT